MSATIMPLTLNTAYGTKELADYETRLVAVFARSYQQARLNPRTLEELGVSSSEGPLVEQTADLMQVHYDEHLAFFECILDRSFMAYSMAFFGETAEAARASTRTLDEAQEAKLALLCERAQVEGTERILNLGCGFGSLETYLLTRYPSIHITGITPSIVQAAYLRRRMEQPRDPLANGRFALVEGSFDTLPLEVMGLAQYDLIFSVGVLEHFSNLQATFDWLAALLRPEGRAFHHLIVSQYPIPGFADRQQTRLRRYFPGGRIWPMGELEQQTDTFDLIASWYVNGINYWRTVDAWHQRFWKHMDMLYPEVLDEDAVRFWNEYFSFSKVMFAPQDGAIVGNGQFFYRKR